MIYSDAFPITDEYGRVRFAKNLTEKLLINDGSDNLCIALIGPWGNGKTTTLRYLEQELQDKEGIAVGRFSPFVYDTPGELVSSFYETLTATVGKKDSETARKAGIAFKGLSLAAKTAGFAAEYLLPGGSIVSGVLTKTGEIFSSSGEMAQTAESPGKSTEQLLADAHAAMADSAVRAVVLIDEVDRLMPQEIMQLFRLIRMVANFPNTTYIVAFDRQMVVDALAAQFSGVRLSGSRYLEKIFQAEIPLPFPEKSLLGTRIANQLAEILDDVGVADYDTASESEFRRFWYVYDRHFSDAFRNMRVAKRFWSQVHTLLPLVKDDVNIADFLITEAFRACDPEGFEAVRANLPKFYFRSMNNDTTRKAHQKLLEDMSQSINLPDIEGLLSILFPQFGGFEGQDRDEAARRMRLSSRRFASRYFDYSVSRDDISSKMVRDAIKNANNGEPQYEALKRIIDTKPGAVGRLLEDLHAFASTLSNVEVQVLSRDLVRLMSGLPEQGHFFDSPVFGVAEAAARMIAPLKDNEKFSLLAELTQTGGSLIGLVNLLDWFRPREDDQTRLPADKWNELRDVLAERIAEADKEHPLHLTQPIGAAKRLYDTVLAAEKIQAVSSRLGTRLRNAPTDVLQLLMHVVGKSTSGQGSHPSDLNRDAYEFLCEIVRPNVIADAIRAVASISYEANTYPRFGVDEAAHLSNVTGTMQAAQFLWLYEHQSRVSKADRESASSTLDRACEQRGEDQANAPT